MSETEARRCNSNDTGEVNVRGDGDVGKAAKSLGACG
jgi:hypothetical protein